jgi:hypothetical protein
MRVNEIKKTVEQVVRVEYVAEDGQIFYNEEECKKYEESALFAVSKQLKRLNTKELNMYSLLDEGCEDDLVEIFNIQTEKDLENLSLVVGGIYCHYYIRFNSYNSNNARC